MPNEVTKFINSISNRIDLSEADSTRLFQIMMNGGSTPAQIAATLIGLKTKGETIDEISGAVKLMRHKMIKLPISDELKSKAIDVCGTGGDNKGTFNISTAVAFVVAGCGVPVAKHGNKAVSSNSGSADVLSEMGVIINLKPEQSAQCLQEAGVAFLFAPVYHKTMIHVAPTRQELGTRTIFNILGPLINPAEVNKQVIGVYDKNLVLPICNVLKNLGSKAAMVVHSEDGLDEISICDKTYVAELANYKIFTYEIKPESLGIERVSIEKLYGGDAKFNAKALKEVLTGARNEYRDAVLINAAAALKVAGLATNLQEGIMMASESIDYKKANGALNKLVEISNSFMEIEEEEEQE